MSDTLPHIVAPERPKYWADDRGGQLAAAVLHYVRRQELTVREVWLLTAYLRQWVDSPVWDLDPHLGDGGRAELADLRKLTKGARTQRVIDECVARLVDLGMDPL